MASRGNGLVYFKDLNCSYEEKDTSGTWVRGLSGPAKHSKKTPLRGGPLRLCPCI